MKINLNYSKKYQVICYAAEELKTYLNKSSLNLTFTHQTDSMDTANQYTIQLLFQSDLTDYHMPPVSNPYLDDQYKIHLDQNGGYIIGTNPRSILLGVYAYLYQLGYRFLYMNKQYDYIPPLESVKDLYIDHSHTASLRHRGVCIEGANSIENIQNFIEWLPKIGMNSFFVQFRIPYTFMARWYEHERNPYISKEEFNMDIAVKYSDIIDQELIKRSLLHHRVGHGWTSEIIGYPSLGWMNTDYQISEDKKEFLAQINGKREFFHGIPMNTNLCYANPDVIQDFVDEVIHYSLEHPDADYLHVWLADEYNNICECKECIKSTPSDQYIAILNQIDEKMNELGLSTHIVFLLYQELLWTPQEAKLNNPQRFTLMFAPISRTFEESYQLLDTYDKPPKYERNQIQLPTDLHENIAFLKEWQNIFHGDSFVYDYPMGRAHYGDLGYTKIAQIIYHDIIQLPKINMQGYISCQELRVGLPNAFPNYVMGYTLLDNTISLDELKTDYFKHLYGIDYKRVLDYLDTLSSLSNTDYYNGKGPRESKTNFKHFTKALDVINNFRSVITSNIEQYSRDSFKAITVAKENHKQLLYFWNLLFYHNEYCSKLLKSLMALTTQDTIGATQYWDEFHTFICNNETIYQEALDVYRITEVSTKYTGFTAKNN